MRELSQNPMLSSNQYNISGLRKLRLRKRWASEWKIRQFLLRNPVAKFKRMTTGLRIDF